MTADAAVQDADSEELPARILRGDFNPTEQMEAFQRAYLDAILAAAGCILYSSSTDDGIDAIIKHRSSEHLNDVDHFLQIQLKASSTLDPGDVGTVKAQFRKERFELFAAQNPTIPKIVVIMVQPPLIDDWMRASHKRLALRHCSYWVNIAGQTTDVGRPYVYAPRTQIFDDRGLCEIMARVGQGGAP